MNGTGHRVRRLSGLAAVVGLLLAAPSALAAASISVSPGAVAPGGGVTVSGSTAGGCASGDSVTLISEAFDPAHEFAGVPAITTQAGSGGEFSINTTIPASRAPGSYSVSGRCGGGRFGDATIHVVSATSGIPRTGMSAGHLALLGLLLLCTGAVLRVSSDRPRIR